MVLFKLLFLSLYFWSANTQDPTLYEYYTDGGITSGLSVDQSYFTLNTKNITILSGAIHYFRVPKQYWRDRLLKLRAAGLNTLETYVAWNLHEPQNDVFDFGDGGNDMSDFLDLIGYLKLAQELDLFVILRPGPFICAEWEWGGLPSWLLSIPGMAVRIFNKPYINEVQQYFEKLIPMLVDLQFTKGGPIIAVQVENEYGSAPFKDVKYIQKLYDLLKDNGIVELLVSSDSVNSGTSGTLPTDIFQTINFGDNPALNLDSLTEFQPDKPHMVMEFWDGWFDHWSEFHHMMTPDNFRSMYETILSYPASVSLYMFHGGTNFGFLNGANIDIGDNSDYQPTTTSYDYDAPLSEAGDYTEKYDILVELIEKYNPVKVLRPEKPAVVARQPLEEIPITDKLVYDDIVALLSDKVTSEKPLAMENLSFNNGTTQSYGYVIYRQEKLDIPANTSLKITGRIRDTIMVLINGVQITTPLETSRDLNDFGYYRLLDSTIQLTDPDTGLTAVTLDLVIENCGRANFGLIYMQYKGLTMENQVFMNDQELSNWLIMPMEWKTSWNKNLAGWKAIEGENWQTGPSLFKGTLSIDTDPADTTDTFIDMRRWTKGFVMVNGFVLGRYAKIGPQQSLYLPGVFLQKGDNEIVIFEHYVAANEIRFSVDPLYKTI